MNQLQFVVQAKGAEAAHRVLQQKQKRKCTVVAYPVNAQNQACLLHYIACSDKDIRGIVEASLRDSVYRSLIPTNELGDLVILVRLLPSEIARRLGAHIVLD